MRRDNLDIRRKLFHIPTGSEVFPLRRTQRLFVIARDSTFTYKGKPVKIRQVSEELGVRYVLEGSIRKTGDRVRIPVQLIDALTGNHLWAERYDREIKDIFALQDEITLWTCGFDSRIRRKNP
jgi:adenylate cyclase